MEPPSSLVFDCAMKLGLWPNSLFLVFGSFGTGWRMVTGVDVCDVLALILGLEKIVSFFVILAIGNFGLFRRREGSVVAMTRRLWLAGRSSVARS